MKPPLPAAVAAFRFPSNCSKKTTPAPAACGSARGRGFVGWGVWQGKHLILIMRTFPLPFYPGNLQKKRSALLPTRWPVTL